MKAKHIRGLAVLRDGMKLEFGSRYMYHWEEFGDELKVEMFVTRGRTRYFMSFDLPRDIDSYDEDAMAEFLADQLKEYGVKR